MALSSYTQTKGKHDDYIVLNNNDTIYGKVLTYGGGPKREGWVRVKTNGEKLRYRTSEVPALRIKGRDYWRQEYLHIRPPAITGYLQVLVAGKVSLLYSYCPTADMRFDLYMLLEDGQVIAVNRTNFDRILRPLLEQSETFRRQTGPGEAPYPKKNRKYLPIIEQYVRWYNEG